MKKITRHWAHFFHPGVFVSEYSTRDLPEETRPELIEWPNSAYAMQLWRRTDIVDDDDQEYLGKPEKVGKLCYHPDSKVESVEEVRGNPNATPTLVRNMECNQWEYVVWSRNGDWPQPFDPEKCTVLPKPGVAA